MPLARVNGMEIAFRRNGGGEPLLMIHGITTYSFLWKDMIPGLTGEFDVVAPDLLNCGESQKVEGRGSSIGAQSRMIAGLLDELGIEKTHIVAHDVGGGVAQIVAVRFPGRVRTLTLVNPVGYDYWPVQPIVSMRVPILRLLGLAAFDFGVFRAIVKRGFYHRERVDDLLMELYQRPLKTREGKEGFLNFAAALDNAELMEIAGSLPGLSVPVMIIRGDADIYLKPVIAERLHREIPGSRLERIATAGHFSPLDEPEKHVALIRDFISSSR